MASTALVTQEFLPEQRGFPIRHLEALASGSNLLVETGSVVTLLKYQDHVYEELGGNLHRVNRHTYIQTVPHGLLPPRICTSLPTKQRVRRKAQGSILGTHRLDFIYDPEFGEYLPSSEKGDLYLTLAEELYGGEIRERKHPVTMTFERDLICRRLAEVTRPQYFEEVVHPFLDERPTRFRMPKWQWFFPFLNIFSMQQAFAKATRGMPDGAFVYVGCKEEVYLLGVVKDSNGSPYLQGTYTASSRPPLYFSNNYLEFFSRTDAQKPLWKGGGMVNVAKYRIRSPAGFEGHQFIYPQMGRQQNCKNTVFTGKPAIITSDLDKALAHFAGTDFAEFADLVERYAATMDSPAPPELNCSQYGNVYI